MSPGKQPAAIDPSRALDRIRSHWLAQVVHELSNPLFAARGYARLVAEERNGGSSESGNRYLDAVLENLERLVAATRNLKDPPQPSDFEFAVICFEDLVEQAVLSLRPQALQKNVRLVESLSSVSTVGDGAKLALAIQSLLLAAVEFTSPLGEIHVEAREENEKAIIRIAATGGPTASSEGPVPDTAVPSELFRLHGGSVSASVGTDQSYHVTGELPIIRQSEC